MIDLTTWMIDTITTAAPSGVSAYGDLSFAAQSTLLARVQQSSEIKRDGQGAEFAASHVVYTETALALETRVWIPGASTGSVDQARVVRVAQSTHDRNGGQTLYKAWLA